MKKTIKNLLCATAAIMLSFSLAACNHSEPAEDPKTLLENANEKMKKLDSLSMDMDISINMEMSGTDSEGYSLDMPIQMTVQMAGMQDDLMYHMNMETSMFGSNVSTEQTYYDGTVYTAIYSFGEELKDYIKNAADAKDAVQKTIGKFFKTAFKTSGKYAYDPHLKPDDFEWCGAIHTNTEHIHAHLIFFEKEKKFSKKGSNEKSYWTALHPKLEKENINNYRFYVSNYVLQNQIDYEKRDLFLDAFKDNFNNESTIDIIRKHALRMDDCNVKQYARLTDKNKKIVKDCYDELLKFNPDLRKKKDDFERQLDMFEQRYNKINEANKIKRVEDFKEKRMEDIFNRNANSILKVMIQSRKIKKLKKDYKTNRSSNYRYYPNDPKLIRAKAIEIRQNERQHEKDVNNLIKILSSVDYWDFNYQDLSMQIGTMRD